METPNFINIAKENFKTQVTQNHIRKERISTPQISTNARRFRLQKLSSNKATGCPQKPAQSWAAGPHSPNHSCSKHSLFLGTRVQKEIITPNIDDISFKTSKFNIHRSTLMSESHALEQRLLILFKKPISPNPPVTNRHQSTTCIEKTARSHYKIPCKI